MHSWSPVCSRQNTVLASLGATTTRWDAPATRDGFASSVLLGFARRGGSYIVWGPGMIGLQGDGFRLASPG